MKIFNKLRAQTFLLLLCVFACSGCVNLTKAFPDISFYSFRLSPQRGAKNLEQPVKLRLASFKSAEAFADRYLTYRTGDGSYEQDFYNQWVAAPEFMVAEQIEVWFSNSAVILKKDSDETPDFEISGEILSLCGDYRKSESSYADLQINFTVTAPNKNSKVIFQKIYSSEIPLTRPSPSLLTQGLTKGLNSILESFDMDLKELRKASS